MRLGILLFTVSTAWCQWTQWGGPGRNFQLPAEAAARLWPKDGPKQLWARDLGDGYSSMVIASGTLYTMYRKGSQDVVIAVDPATGKTVWETPIDAPHPPGMNVEAGPGPHATPCIVGEKIFVTTVIAQLVALERNTGKIIWRKDLWKELKGNQLDRGYAASPLPYKENIIVPVGGPGRALVAFSQKDGRQVWSKGNANNSFSSPILITVDGKDQIVNFTADGAMGQDAATGELFWSVNHKTQYDINAATPVWCESAKMIVVSSAYDGGARGIGLSGEGGREAKEVWHHRRLRVHHTNMVCKDGIVYGSSGDFGPAPLSAVDAKTGTVKWQTRAFSKASILLAGDKLFVTDDDGSVGMAKITNEGLEVLGEQQLLKANSWTVPMLNGKTLFVRDRHRMLALMLD